MNTRLKTMLILSAVTLTVVGAAVSDAAAEVRIGVSVRSPGLEVRVGDAARPHVVVRPQPAPRAVAPITREDRRIARRLASYMGVDERSLLRLRARGLTWRLVAREYGLSARVAEAAFSARSWERFLNGRKPIGWCGTRVR
ncbi:hypothetical protein KDK88_01545 [bacterium]|nr:hypothetical protein [bacterium]